MPDDESFTITPDVIADEDAKQLVVELNQNPDRRETLVRYLHATSRLIDGIGHPDGCSAADVAVEGLENAIKFVKANFPEQ